MNKQAIGQHIVMDRNWWRKHGWLDRLVIRLFRNTINHCIKYVLCRGMERGIVGPNAFHELAGICDQILWPERYPKGQWVCSQCGHTENQEREIVCWKCGKGEMLYADNADVSVRDGD